MTEESEAEIPMLPIPIPAVQRVSRAMMIVQRRVLGEILMPRGGSVIQVDDLFPADAKVVSVHAAHEHDGLAIILESKAFPETPEGQILPTINPMYTQKTGPFVIHMEVENAILAWFKKNEEKWPELKENPHAVIEGLLDTIGELEK